VIELEINTAQYRAGMAGLFRMPEALRTKLIEAITASTIELGSAVQSRVPRDSGRLASAMVQEVKVLRKMVIGKVKFPSGGKGSHGFLATFFEGGAKSSTVEVKAHIRRSAGQASEKMTKAERAKASTGQVKAYTRRNALLSDSFKPFMAPAWDSVRFRVEARINAAVEAAIAEGR
jgi:hypothetical protein